VKLECPRKGKGCDIGYALAASSCEGAHSVEACTVTALDAITAFAVPNPNSSSQSSRFFQVWLPFGSPRRANHSAYFGLAKFYLSQPFQPSTEAKVNTCGKSVNDIFRCNVHPRWACARRMQLIELRMLVEYGNRNVPVFHRIIHKHSEATSGL
jgi:hypothetical protein